MMQSVESQLSTDELSFIEANQFGAPLGVYRLNSGYRRFFHIAGMFLFFLAAVLLILAILDFIKRLQPDDSLLIQILCPCVSSLIFGWIFFWIEAPRAQHEHIIICEQGFLHIGRDIRGKEIEMVRWADIRRVSTDLFGLGYSIVRREGKPLTLSLYQDMKGLIEFIRERTEMR